MTDDDFLAITFQRYAAPQLPYTHPEKRMLAAVLAASIKQSVEKLHGKPRASIGPVQVATMQVLRSTLSSPAMRPNIVAETLRALYHPNVTTIKFVHTGYEQEDKERRLLAKVPEIKELYDRVFMADPKLLNKLDERTLMLARECIREHWEFASKLAGPPVSNLRVGPDNRR